MGYTALMKQVPRALGLLQQSHMYSPPFAFSPLSPLRCEDGELKHSVFSRAYMQYTHPTGVCVSVL